MYQLIINQRLGNTSALVFDKECIEIHHPSFKKSFERVFMLISHLETHGKIPPHNIENISSSAQTFVHLHPKIQLIILR